MRDVQTIGSREVVAAMLVLLASPVMAQDPQPASTRASILDDARQALTSQTAPPTRSKVETGLYWYDNQYLLTKVLRGWKGIHLAGGDFPAGAGTKFGIGYDRALASSDPDPALPNRVGVTARAAYSTMGYARVSAGVNARNLRGLPFDVSGFSQYYEFPQEDFFGFGIDSLKADRTNYLLDATESGGSARWRPFFVALRARGYRWWIDRTRALLAHVDVIRLDHFRGFAAAWHAPASAPTAEAGEWVPGPGSGLFAAADQALGALPFLAEDLGIITPDVSAPRVACHLPGTRVLQFAFDGHADNPHVPANCVHNTVVYTGTHDNPTTRGWYEDLSEAERRNLWRSMQRADGTAAEAAPSLLRLAWSSPAALAIAPLQDVLNLGKDARMNQPGSPDGNWRWRAIGGMLSSAAFESLRELTRPRHDPPASHPPIRNPSPCHRR